MTCNTYAVPIPRPRLAAWLIGAILVGLSAAAGVLFINNTNDVGRSTVGMARRSDGSVVMVTAWCAGQRMENPRVEYYTGSELPHADARLYEAVLESNTPLTVHAIGRGQPQEIRVNKPIRGGVQLIAFNSGRRSDLLRATEYPSSASLFVLNELPVSDEAVPPRVLTGNHRLIDVNVMAADKCIDPKTGRTLRYGQGS